MIGQSDADMMKEQLLRTPEAEQGQQEQLEQDDPQVVYMTSDQGPFQCQNCTYFVDPNACQKVSGEIDPEGCCNLFEKAGKVENNDIRANV